MFVFGLLKDSVKNVCDIGYFCVNIVGVDMVDIMNLFLEMLLLDVDEFVYLGVIKIDCSEILVVWVLGVLVVLECVIM